ncbi:DDE-type integrase/transposase/recombinase [Paraburkholderia terrae]|uniref:DDE-type integrase/transposase/recombinase n=1 Tax=Paraburkholderia terrae TaxID=311230 RepID=UPI00296B52D1|nr:DDE-type integrase/transposase/recombinase [Paraburkholderia terrae]MDW3663259.1 DDE-type integrase/transposase/recombinase [Paraburkholderia terrae]
MTIATESAKPEFPRIVKLELLPAVREYYPQPKKVYIPRSLKRRLADGTVITLPPRPLGYTPDLLILMPTAILIEEWKTEQGLQGLHEKDPLRIYKQDATWRCPEFEDYFAEMGLTFHLRSAEENGAIFTQNVYFLRSYFEDPSPLDGETLAALKLASREATPLTLAELTARGAQSDSEAPLFDRSPNAFAVEDIFKAITTGHLFVDLEYDDLTEPMDTIVCFSQAQLQLLKWNRPAPAHVSEEADFKVGIGTQFQFKGDTTKFTICGKTDQIYFYTEETHAVNSSMSHAQFATARWNRDILVISSSPTERDVLDGMPYIDDARILKAWEWRQLLVAREKGISISKRCSLRHIQRMQRRMRLAGASIGLQIRALLDKPRSGGRHQIEKEQEDLVIEITHLTDTSTNPTNKYLFDRYCELSDNRGIKKLSSRSFVKLLKKTKDVKAREGARIAYNQESPTWYLHREDKLHGGWPFHCVHIDHTQLDVIVEVRGKGNRIFVVRLWLTIAIDTHCRVLLGFYLSGHPPSAVSCMMIIRDIVRRHRRRPRMLVVDNGKEFHSRAFDSLVKLLDIDLRYRPKHESRFGNVCERFFGLTNTEIIHNMIGNTKALVHVRTVTRSVDPINAKHLQMEVLHGLLDYFFFHHYNNKLHPAHDHTPNEYMAKRDRELGRDDETSLPYDEQFYIATCLPPRFHGVTRMVTRKGILIDGHYYWSDAFHDSDLWGKHVLVRVDMWNPCVAWAMLNNAWIKCASRFLMQFRTLTAIEMRYAGDRVRLGVKNGIYESFESGLSEILRDYDALPPAAAITAASRKLYSDSHLTGSEFDSTFDIDAVVSQLEVNCPLSDVEDASEEQPESNGQTKPKRLDDNDSLSISEQEYRELPPLKTTDGDQ